MGDPSEVIDLTNPLTAALVRAVIEVNVDAPPPRPRRTRITRIRTKEDAPTLRLKRTCITRTRATGVQIDIVNIPVENFLPSVRSRTTSPQNVPQESQSGHLGEEVVRDRSPLDNGTARCAICLEKLRSQPLCCTKCGHVFCQSCLQQSLHKKKICPSCRKCLRGNQSAG